MGKICVVTEVTKILNIEYCTFLSLANNIYYKYLHVKIPSLAIVKYCVTIGANNNLSGLALYLKTVQ